jgi:hypothetical protein
LEQGEGSDYTLPTTDTAASADGNQIKKGRSTILRLQKELLQREPRIKVQCQCRVANASEAGAQAGLSQCEGRGLSFAMSVPFPLSVHHFMQALCEVLMVDEDMVVQVSTGPSRTEASMLWPLDADSTEALGDRDASLQAGHSVFVETKALLV